MKYKFNRKKSALLVFILTFLLIGISIMNISCSSTDYILEKMESSLHQRIIYIEKENPDAIVQFAGKSDKIINDEMKKQLESTGATVESIIQDIFTASGKAESIKKTSLLEFIVYLEIAKNLDLKNK
jgi:predicted PurR-regulated permease PerM